MTTLPDKHVNCIRCGVRLNSKNINKHRKKCTVISKKQPGNKPGIYSTKKEEPYASAYQPNKETKQERTLDGSRDYAQIRDHGRFGSHSLYDDMNDESTS